MEAAFFDLDKTIIARSSTLAFGRPLYKEGFIGRSELIKGIYAQLVYLITGADEEKMERMRQALLDLTRGWDRDKLSSLVQETLSEIVDPIIYAEAMDLVEQHVAEGRSVYIVSSSAEEIVAPLAHYLGIPNAIATKAAVDEEGKYTGELDFYCYGEGKRQAMIEEAVTNGIELSKSYAYSDSVTDVPMLEAVGFPHAVNPDKELRAVAEERGWPILEFSNPVSVRQRLRERGAVLAERGARLAKEVTPFVTREVPRMARAVPRAATRRAREAQRDQVMIAVAAVAAALLGVMWLRRQRAAI